MISDLRDKRGRIKRYSIFHFVDKPAMNLDSRFSLFIYFFSQSCLLLGEICGYLAVKKHKLLVLTRLYQYNKVSNGMISITVIQTDSVHLYVYSILNRYTHWIYITSIQDSSWAPQSIKQVKASGEFKSMAELKKYFISLNFLFLCSILPGDPSTIWFRRLSDFVMWRPRMKWELAICMRLFRSEAYSIAHFVLT